MGCLCPLRHVRNTRASSLPHPNPVNATPGSRKPEARGQKPVFRNSGATGSAPSANQQSIGIERASGASATAEWREKSVALPHQIHCPLLAQAGTLPVRRSSQSEDGCRVTRETWSGCMVLQAHGSVPLPEREGWRLLVRNACRHGHAVYGVLRRCPTAKPLHQFIAGRVALLRDRQSIDPSSHSASRRSWKPAARS
jgi:hypothetical protein